MSDVLESLRARFPDPYSKESLCVSRDADGSVMMSFTPEEYDTIRAALEQPSTTEAQARARELEQMLKRFINADSFRVDASVPYPDAPFGDTTERLMAARKLLEKGNE